MRHSLAIIWGIVIVFASCDSSNKLKTHNSGLKYKYLIHNDTAQLAQNGDVLNLNLTYATAEDSILFDTDNIPGPFRMILGEPTHNGGSFEDGLSLLHVGDSIYFEVKAKDFFASTQGIDTPEFIDPESPLKFNVGLIKIEAMEDIEREQEALRSKNKEMEQQLLTDYLKENNITVKPSNSGIYFIVLEDSKGQKAKAGDAVHVHYTGSLINGEVFDSSVERGEQFTFNLGTGQVIQAWDESVARMKVGQKVRIIAPSHTAYGPNGYSPIIPPYSTLIFDIELIGLN